MSTFAYLGSMDFARASELGFTSITITKSGDPTYSATLSTASIITSDATGTCTVFCHADVGLGRCIGEDRAASTAMRRSYSSFSIANITSYIVQAAATTAGVTPEVYFLFDADTLAYTIGGVTGKTITFGNELTAALFGFSDVSLSGAATHTSDITPWGIIRPVLSDVSEPTTNYEPESIAIQAVSAGNSVVGLQRSTVPLYRDWTQQYESKAKSLRLHAIASHPFTHQELFETHRTSIPFVVQSGFAEQLDEVFYLRSDGSAWKPERATAANDTQFHVPYKTVVAGQLVPVEGF